jgi:ribosomal protein L24E
MIRTKDFGNGVIGPVVTCDKCGKRLNDGEVVVYLRKDSSIEFYCKRYLTPACDPGRRRPDSDGWFELSVFIHYLVHNTKTDLERGQRLGEALSGV